MTFLNSLASVSAMWFFLIQSATRDRLMHFSGRAHPILRMLSESARGYLGLPSLGWALFS